MIFIDDFLCTLYKFKAYCFGDDIGVILEVLDSIGYRKLTRLSIR